MRWLFAGLVALVASVGVALFALPDPGYVLIGFGKYSLETTLLVFVVVLGLVYVSLRMLAGLWHVPARVRRWNYRRESRRQRKLFDGAVMELVEGRPERAERRLARLAYSSETPLDVYLSAARVANRIGAQDRRDYYLKLALERNPKAEIAIALVQAELQLDRAQFDQAQTTLTRLRALAPRNSEVMRLLMQLYLQQKDWPQLRSLLPELQRSRILASEQWQRLAVQVYREQILELVKAGRSPEELAQEFEPTAQTIRNWIRQAELDAGERQDGLSNLEREELARLRRENKQLRLEREIAHNQMSLSEKRRKDKQFGKMCKNVLKKKKTLIGRF